MNQTLPYDPPSEIAAPVDPPCPNRGSAMQKGDLYSGATLSLMPEKMGLQEMLFGGKKLAKQNLDGDFGYPPNTAKPAG